MDGESEPSVSLETYPNAGCSVLGCFVALLGLYFLVEFFFGVSGV